MILLSEEVSLIAALGTHDMELLQLVAHDKHRRGLVFDGLGDVWKLTVHSLSWHLAKFNIDSAKSLGFLELKKA